MIPVVLLAIDSRTLACLLSLSVLRRILPSPLPDYGHSEGWLIHYSRDGPHP